MNTAYAKLEGGTVTLRWKDTESFGCLDLLPLSWFIDDSSKSGVTHTMKEPGAVDSKAKCDVTINGAVAILDYRPYEKENRKNGSLLGEVRLTFGNLQRSLIEKVEWRGIKNQDFQVCKFDLIFLFSDVFPNTIGPRASFHRTQEIAEFLTSVREICPNCAITKRIGRGWIFVPPSLFKFEPAQDKNLVTFWAGIKHHSIDIRRPRRGRGRNTSSEGKEPYDPLRLDEFKDRMRARISEMAPADMVAKVGTDISPPVKISALQFRHAYERFQALQIKANGSPLVSFRNTGTLAYEWENYKTGIPEVAKLLLSASTWKQVQIGTGEIIAAVIRAIEIKGNNLLQWEGRHGPDSRVHLKLIHAEKNPSICITLETALFKLYRKGEADRLVFDTIVEHCGARYELLAYLFFIAQPHRFLPVRTSYFDKAFFELGVDLVTQGSCGWENYNAYCDVIREVQRCLIGEGIADATLLDAHSFCWILARSSEDEPPSQIVHPAPPEPFTGSLKLAVTNQNFTPKDDTTIRDMQALADKRAASGRVAEEIALASERERLTQGGRPDLAVQVEDVSKKPGLGYDLRSYELDGSERFIEVKNVSGGARFFLSSNEWMTSRSREKNYWFYLVHENNAGTPKVTHMVASELTAAHLTPTQYMVCFKA